MSSPETTQAIARCECCDLPETSCGKAAEKRQADELAAFRRALLAQPAWHVARFSGICPCGTPFPAGVPIRRGVDYGHGAWLGECCAETPAGLR